MSIKAKISNLKKWTVKFGVANGGTRDHRKLTNRDAEGQHPMSAIIGLVAALQEPKAHAEAKTNPHGVTAEQVGARPDTWMPTAAQVGARPATWTPTADDVGAAPEGYGLGEAPKKLTTMDEVNAATTNGWYRIVSSNQLTIAGWSATDWWMQVTAYSADYCVQRIFPMGKAQTELIRRRYAGEWVEEWVNPPMHIGNEYRTTERWQGKPVYTKAYDFGALPNASRRTANHNIANMDACLDAYGVTYADSDPYGYFFPLYSNTNGVGIIGIYVNKVNATVTTTVDWSDYNAIIVLKYTKTTD